MSYRNHLVFLLLLIVAFNNVDRYAMGVILQDLKADLLLSDSQLGLLTGIAFAFFYAVMGIPIARWADRGNRVTIITLTTGLWSVMVALCGAAMSFVQLLAIRVAVSVGEAGCYPPATSLIADYFAPAERPRAMAHYFLGGSLALLIGYFAAGWINELYGWRMTFVVLGAPGLILALLAATTLKEPRRRRTGTAPALMASPPFKEVCMTLWFNIPFRHLLFCYAAWSFFGSGILQWQPAFFVRSQGFTTGELGTWFALIYGIGGLAGTWLGGELATRYAAGNERLQLMAIAILFVFFAALTACAYLATNGHVALGFLAVAAVGGAATYGPLFAAIQTLVPAPMRATAIAILYFFSNLIGTGLGPLLVGVLSDALRPHFGSDSLRYALLACCPGYLWIAFHAIRAGKHFNRGTSAADVTVAIRVAQ